MGDLPSWSRRRFLAAAGGALGAASVRGSSSPGRGDLEGPAPHAPGQRVRDRRRDAARRADDLHHAERPLLRPPPLEPDVPGRETLGPRGGRGGRDAARADARRPEAAAPRRGDLRAPVRGQRPRPVPADRPRRAVEIRRRGQRAMVRRAREGRAREGGIEGHGAASALLRQRQAAREGAAVSPQRRDREDPRGRNRRVGDERRTAAGPPRRAGAPHRPGLGRRPLDEVADAPLGAAGAPEGLLHGHGVPVSRQSRARPASPCRPSRRSR